MRLSICIPTYNRIFDLKMCLCSVFSAIDALSSHEVVEVIVSHNPSSDGTREYIENLDVRSKNVKFFGWTNEENIGAVRNIKKLISAASGEYLFCLTDDDLLLPNALVVLKKYLDEQSFLFLKTALVNYLIKSKKCFYYGAKKFLSDGIDRKNFIEIMKFSHVLSGCIVKNSDFLTKNLSDSNNVYPSIEMCAMSAGNCAFIDEPVVFHQWENEIFWEKDIDMSSDNSRNLQTNRDAQLALLHIPDNFLSQDQVSVLYSYLLSHYHYIEPMLIDKFQRLADAEIKQHSRDLAFDKFGKLVRSLLSIKRIMKDRK